jgi:hypothetical protein
MVTYTMDKSIVTKIRPRAKFIWSKEERKPNTYYLFRRELSVDKDGLYTLYISAHYRYRLYINGCFMADGPPPSLEFAVICDLREISLRSGKNCVAVEVWNTEDGHAPFFIIEMRDDSGNILFTTDESWPAFRAPIWRQDTRAGNAA